VPGYAGCAGKEAIKQMPDCLSDPSTVSSTTAMYQDRYVSLTSQTRMWANAQLMVALPNIGGALCSTLQSLAEAHY